MTSGGIDVSISVVPESQEAQMGTEQHEETQGEQQQQQNGPPLTHPMDALRMMSISGGAARGAGAGGAGTSNSSGSMLPPAPVRTAGSAPARRVQRNKSGSGMPPGRVMRGRAPPKRSQSHKIGRPTFDPKAPAEPVRGVNRSSSNRVKGAPGRTSSFNRRVPGRSSSTSSLRGGQKRGGPQQPGSQAEGGGPDDISVSDSVFTSASNQTLDSIMLRKKQIDHDHEGNPIPGRVGGGPMRGTRAGGGGGDYGTRDFEFDESLHTVDSMHLRRNHHHGPIDGNNEEYYDDQDMSVFSESFASNGSDFEVLSDYDEEEDEEYMDGPIKEDEETTVSKSNEDVDESME
eukprot:CAMPEP_0113494330 /NCGR_PEP_ID=MMETSP0014_2-20120614/29050_1 /TAXON_ID=2857 /ORGANISM="Nitzschia sp." /LENGTH=344 /DNA_ID=CAMNT_0000388217 /DNA_START=240 /DNA_END=1274 /DNA_ORIENTATION=- /assembly_acc=CAM_ASM_000159